MSNYIKYTKPDELFSQQEKELFLKIPHKITNVHPKLDVIDFNVSKNGKYPLLGNVKMVRIKNSPLTQKEYSDFEVRKHIFDIQAEMNELGLFINSSHGGNISNFIKELYKYDKNSAKNLMEKYSNFALECKDIQSIEEKVVRQLNQLTEYLIKEKIEVKDLGLDFVEYSKKTEKEQEKISKEIYKKYGNGLSFDAYNDLDYMPFIYNNDLYIYDSSGARLYFVKSEGDALKIYMKDSVQENFKISDYFQDFMYDHKQKYLLMAKNINETDLIGEIKNGKLVKASIELTIFDLIQSFIVEELYKEDKIKNIVPKLTFEELLDNYTIQKEFYHIKERALIDILGKLVIVDDVLNYEDFSLMKTKKEIKNEDFNAHSINSLKERLNKNNGVKLNQLPQEYKEQINTYLQNLNDKYQNQTTNLVVQYIREEMNKKNNKLKIK